MGGAWVERTVSLFGKDTHWQLGSQQAIAVAAILFFSAVNCFSVAYGARVQSVSTGAKLWHSGHSQWHLLHFAGRKLVASGKSALRCSAPARESDAWGSNDRGAVGL